MRLATQKPKTNRLDAKMTRTQVVRRKFKSALPRSIENRELSPMEAMARTMEMFDRLRGMMHDSGLDPDHASAGLVFHQPHTKGLDRVLAQTIPLPRPEDIGSFVKRVSALDRPRFLGVLFIQHDPETEKAGYKNVAFVWPFLSGADESGRLVAARDSQARGGFKKTAN